MKRAMKIMTLLSLAATLGWSETRSGFLVDAGCFERDERNGTQKDPDVNHNRDFEVRQCAPTAKTTSFIVVQRGGDMFKLDSAGDQKAATIVRNMGKQSHVFVTVNGEKHDNTFKVDSIIADK